MKSNKQNIAFKKATSPKLTLTEQIDSKAKRKLKAQRRTGTSAWFGFGTRPFG